MKFYRYIIYRLYSWRIKSKDDIPIVTVVLTMGIIHSLQLLFIQQFLFTFFPSVRPYIKMNKGMFIVISVGIALLFYLIIYNKEKWNTYIEDFKNETISQRRSGTILVVGFTLGTVVLTFIAAIVFSFFKI